MWNARPLETAIRKEYWLALEWATAALASAAFAVSFGFNYGVDNQLVYLLGALKLVNPQILATDWFASEATHYHPAFSYLAAAVLALDPRGWGIAGAHVLVVTLGTLAVFATLRALVAPRAALPSFLLLLALLFVTRTRSVAVSYVFDYIFQPSTLGSLGLLLSFPFFVRGKWLASGLCLAFGGLFHANYLVLSFAVFGLAHLLLGVRDVLPRLARQLGPSTLVLLVLLPLIWTTGAGDAAIAQKLLFELRAPHHYQPTRFLGQFWPLTAWTALGASVGFSVWRGTAGQRLAMLASSLMVLVWSGTLLTTVVFVPKVAQVFVWRFAPFAELLFQLTACAGAVLLLLQPRLVHRLPRVCLPVAVSALGLLWSQYGTHKKIGTPINVLFTTWCSAVLVAQLVSLAARAGLAGALRAKLTETWARAAPFTVSLLALVSLYALAEAPLRDIERNSTLLKKTRDPNADLFAWMRNTTPLEARFLTPPDLDSVRFHGQRAIVVDWKGTPIVPSEMVEWYDRLKRVTGRTELRSHADLRSYDQLDDSRLKALVERYRLDYVVVRRRAAGPLAHLPKAFETPHYVVLRLGQAGGSSTYPVAP